MNRGMALSLFLIWAMSPIASTQQQGVIHVLDAADGFSSSLGWWVSDVGDVDGDGFADVVSTETNSGVVVSGRDESVLLTFPGSLGPYDAIGDLDQDGIPDILTGIPSAQLVPGSARVHSGKDGSVLLTVTGGMPGDLFGYSVAGVGDADLDGVVDLVVGAPYDANHGLGDEGIATVFSGATGQALHVYDSPAQVRLGWSVSEASDVDLDGYADVVIGLPLAGVTGTSSGSVIVGSGKDGSVLHTVHGDGGWAHFGWWVGWAGDSNGDGVPDFTGTQAANTPLDRVVRIFSGVDGSMLRQFGGWPIAATDESTFAGDFDADGSDDLLVRYRGYPSSLANTVRVHSGADASVLAEWSGKYWQEFGSSLATPGDVNGDGRIDYAIAERVGARVFVNSAHCGTITSYGAGCAPPGWSTPTLVVNGCATPGAELQLNGYGGSFAAPPGLVFAGSTPASTAIGGCTFLVGSLLAVASAPPGPFGAFSCNVDTRPPFGPGTVYLQLLVPATTAPEGFAASAGVAVTFD